MISFYIDPGTGSMLFAILIGTVGALSWIFKKWTVKLRFFISGGKVREEAGKEIPYVIFSDDKRYWTIFEPVCRAFDRRGIDVTYYTASPDDPALHSELPHIHSEFIGEGNKAFARLNFLKATILLSTTPGLDVYQWKRSKEVKFYVHILHQPNEVILYRMFGLDYYDAVLISGQYQELDMRNLEKLRNLPEKELVLTGIPYMDEMVKRLQSSPSAESGNLTVLLAPSWGPSAIFSRFGGKIIDELLKIDCQIIIRPHPQSFTSEKEMIEALILKYPESERLSWNKDRDHFEVLKASDILISDFSGVLFDFALVYDKPVIYTDTGFAPSVYDAWWLDTPLWTFSALPRIGRELKEDNFKDIENLISSCLNDPGYAEGRKEVRKETWAFPGEGAERAVDYLTMKYRELKNQESNFNQSEEGEAAT